MWGHLSLFPVVTCALMCLALSRMLSKVKLLEETEARRGTGTESGLTGLDGFPVPGGPRIPAAG